MTLGELYGRGNCNKTNGIRPKMLKNDRLEQDQWNRAN